jgi:hypothetical protein
LLNHNFNIKNDNISVIVTFYEHANLTDTFSIKTLVTVMSSLFFFFLLLITFTKKNHANGSSTLPLADKLCNIQPTIHLFNQM